MKHRYYFLGILLLVAASAWVVFGKSFPVKRGLDLKGGLRVVLRASPPEGSKWEESLLNDAKNVIQRRVDSLGVTEPLVQTKGSDQIVVELPDISRDQQDAALKQFQQLALLRFVKIPEKYVVDSSVEPPTFSNKVTREEVPPGQVLREGEEIVTGRELLPKSVGNIGTEGNHVELHFNPEGRKKFAEFTKRNVNKYFGIFLDEEPISVPTVREPIPGGDGIISGSFTLDEAQDLANLLNAGALPVPLELINTAEVGPTLGKESVDRSILAGIVGLALVIAFMVLYYRLPGAVAVVALAFYSLFSFALFKLIPVTLTLPGIAGFILSVGMAVDANILIFERLKEELNGGKTLRAAIDAGFGRAFPSIFDSNFCTLITCGVLYNFGTGPIRGFAVVLALGVAVSMFTAITCTRNMLYLLVPTNLSQNPKLWGLGTSWLHREVPLQVVEKKKVWFGLSGAVITVGLVFMGILLFTKGSVLNKGIDFTGGSLLEYRYEQKAPSLNEVKAVLEKAGRGDSQVAIQATEKRVTIRGKAFPADAVQATAQRKQIEDGLQKATGKFVVESAENVGPTMGRELTGNAIKSIIFASVLIIIYLAFRFSSPGSFGLDFGVTAVGALIHDVLILLGFFAVAGVLGGWEVDSLFVTAALTVIGFSVHDTIVVFDRIRENMKYRQRGESFDAVANRSVTQTLARSINTSATVIIVLAVLVILGGGSIREFNVAMLIGIVAGTYSSIFSATPMLAMWRAFERKKAQAEARRPDERPMLAGAPRPAQRQPARPAPAQRSAAPVAASSNGEAESGAGERPAVGTGMTSSGVSKAAPKPQRNIKKKKRRF